MPMLIGFLKGRSNNRSARSILEKEYITIPKIMWQPSCKNHNLPTGVIGSIVGLVTAQQHYCMVTPFILCIFPVKKGGTILYDGQPAD